MGGVCSRSQKATVDGVAVDNAIGEGANGHSNDKPAITSQSLEHPQKINNSSTVPSVDGDFGKQEQESISFPGTGMVSCGPSADDLSDGVPRLFRTLSHKSRATKFKQAAATKKVSEVSSLLGRAGTTGLGKAVDVLDTLGSSMTNLNLSSGFTSSVATKGNKFSVLAFEVANTTVKGASLMQSLSEENIRHLKEVVPLSEGVQNLISRNMDELLRIAEADKREELKIFSGEVVRFGNHCKDPQWHNLDR